MPTVEELGSILDLSRYGPAIDTGYFPNTVTGWYWSGVESKFTLTSGRFRVVSFYYGEDGLSYDASRVRLVRSGTGINPNIAESTPTSRFTFNGGGVVTDNITGLMWKRCLEGCAFSDSGTPDNYLDDTCTGVGTAMNWQAALNWAQTANGMGDSGHNDWRVPNLKELKSIVDYYEKYSYSFADINREVFPFGGVETWSSSPMIYRGYAWSVRYGAGGDAGADWRDRDDALTVRLVRSGQ